MASSGPGALVPIHGRMDGIQYIEILEEVMIPTVRALLLPEPLPIYIAMDNSSVHNSIIVQEWFKKHPDIVRIKWPAKSPDLNPIENLWAIMTSQWEGGNTRSKQALISHCLSVWESLRGQNICETLVDSIPRRLNAVVDNLGSYTKY